MIARPRAPKRTQIQPDPRGEDVLISLQVSIILHSSRDGREEGQTKNELIFSPTRLMANADSCFRSCLFFLPFLFATYLFLFSKAPSTHVNVTSSTRKSTNKPHASQLYISFPFFFLFSFRNFGGGLFVAHHLEHNNLALSFRLTFQKPQLTFLRNRFVILRGQTRHASTMWTSFYLSLITQIEFVTQKSLMIY